MTSFKKYGTDQVYITIIDNQGDSTFDPTDGSVTPERPDPSDEEASDFYNCENTYGIQAIDAGYSDYLRNRNDGIEQSDMFMTVALFGADPTIGSIISIGGVGSSENASRYTVLNVKKISVQGVVIGWQLQCRI